jgi:hypothetical protein
MEEVLRHWRKTSFGLGRKFMASGRKPPSGRATKEVLSGGTKLPPGRTPLLTHRYGMTMMKNLAAAHANSNKTWLELSKAALD